MTIEPARQFATIHEVVKAARNNLHQGVWDYVVGGTDTETTLRRNRMALDSIAFRPRVMRDVSKRTAKARFLGRDLRMPVILAPIGSLESVHEDGAAVETAGWHGQWDRRRMGLGFGAVCKLGSRRG